MTTDFRIFRETAAYNYPFCLIEPIWEALDTPYDPDARLAQLTPGQRAAYALQWIRAEVSNGGFDQCFSNSVGFLIPEAAEGARLLDAPGWAEVISTAAATLGDSFPRDRDDRQRRLDALGPDDEQVLARCDDRLYELDGDPATSLDTVIDRYASAHPDEFYVDAPDEATAARALLATARTAIDATFGRNLPLAARLLTEADERATAAGDPTTAALARSLLAQLPSIEA